MHVHMLVYIILFIFPKKIWQLQALLLLILFASVYIKKFFYFFHIIVMLLFDFLLFDLILQLRQIRSSLDISSAIFLANSLVLSKLDYCNPL